MEKDSEVFSYKTIEKSNTQKEIFDQIHSNYKGYKPQYVIGCSFGVDLNQWRNILSSVFNNELDGGFNIFNRFENAVLFTDSIDIKDTAYNYPDYSCMFHDNLKIGLYDAKDSYLHSKFVLIKYSDNANDSSKYILFVSSKNISNSSNYDYWIILESKDIGDGIISGPANDERSKCGGEKLYDYIKYLLDSCKGTGIDSTDKICDGVIEDLKNKSFVIAGTDNKAEIHILYGNNKIGSRINKTYVKELFEDIRKSTVIVSPYVTKKKYNEWVEAHKDTEDELILLSYDNSLRALSDDLSKDLTNEQDKCKWFTGKTDNAVLRFHSKIFARKNKKSVLYIGSLNLTDRAFDNNCEMIVKLEGDEAWYDELDGLFTGNLKEIDRNKIPETDDPDNEDGYNDNNEDNSNIEKRSYKVAIAKHTEKNSYRYYIYTGKELHYINETRKLTACFYMNDDQENDERIIIFKGNYLDIPNELEKWSDSEEMLTVGEKQDEYEWMSYMEFSREIALNREKYKEKYEDELLLGRYIFDRNGESTKGNRSNKNERTYVTEYPCIYKYIHGILKKKLDKKKSEGKIELSEVTDCYEECLNELNNRLLSDSDKRDYIKKMKDALEQRKSNCK